MIKRNNGSHEPKPFLPNVHLKGVALSNAERDESMMLSGYINLEFHQNLKRLAQWRRTRKHSL